ncbi:hypothetical protein AI2828V5_5099 [Klebsiella oxytoca]|nr:hypothetical protein KONIH1_03250 [Klebsiella oxytoca KONIH1]CAF2412138.1 hypothetical protein AI2828V5_5099 [Klebsiella oxytoca]CAH5836512.1 hypothetical protein AI2828V5_5099 [Klebsiella oxytoca]
MTNESLQGALLFMNTMIRNALDEVYDDVYEAFEEKFETLVTKFKDSGQNEELSMIRTNAHEIIEEFKAIEEELPERIVDKSYPGNFRLYQEFIDVNGIVVPKPYVYKKTYAEARANIHKEMFEGRISGTIKLVNENSRLIYLLMVFKDFYWSEYLLSSGNKKDSCKYLLYALFYMSYVEDDNDKTKLGDWHRLNARFDRVRGKIASSCGGKGGRYDIEYLKPYISSALSDYSPEGGWKSKKQFIDTIIPYIVMLDEEFTLRDWDDEFKKREEQLRKKIDEWLLNELKTDYDKFIRNKNRC